MPSGRIDRLPDLEILEKWFALDAENGTLTWRNPPTGRGYSAKPGDVVGTICARGRYLGCIIERKSYRVHRIVWKMLHGRDPGQLQHVDGNGLNNRPENLIELKRHKREAWPFPGLFVARMLGQDFFGAVLFAGGIRHRLGIHRQAVDAARAYNDASLRLLGQNAVLIDLDKVQSAPKSRFPRRSPRA